MNKSYDIQDVLDSGINLEPLVCRACGSKEVNFNSSVKDAHCENCGKWQLELKKGVN